MNPFSGISGHHCHSKARSPHPSNVYDKQAFNVLLGLFLFCLFPLRAERKISHHKKHSLSSSSAHMKGASGYIVRDDVEDLEFFDTGWLKSGKWKIPLLICSRKSFIFSTCMLCQLSTLMEQFWNWVDPYYWWVHTVMTFIFIQRYEKSRLEGNHNFNSYILLW